MCNRLRIYAYLVAIVLFVTTAQTSATFIVILNGTSSAGKTTLAKNIQEVMHAPVKIVQVDTEYQEIAIEKLAKRGYIYDHAQNFFAWFFSLPDQLKASLAREVNWSYESLRCMLARAKKLHAEGFNVVIDTVFDTQQELGAIKAFFQQTQIRVFFVLVYASIDKLEKNLSERNGTGKFEEGRGLLFPFVEYFCDMFKRCPLNDPALLDRISRTQITGLFNKIKDLIKTHKDTAEFQELKNIIEREFFTKDVDVIGIAPKLEYDFIVNSNTKSSIECARELVLWISSDKIVSKHARQAGS